jgi:hypothetical protein
MAANPLPRPRRSADTIPTYEANAASGNVDPVVDDQPINWTNGDTLSITIATQPNANGKYPLTENSFTVNGTGSPVNTHLNYVLSNASDGDYTFTRTQGGVPMGGGKIVISSGFPTR